MGGTPKWIGHALAANRHWFAKHKSHWVIPFFVIGTVLSPSTSKAAQIMIDFEALADSEAVTTQFAGLSFTHAAALTADISFNEFEFPARLKNHSRNGSCDIPYVEAQPLKQLSTYCVAQIIYLNIGRWIWPRR